MASLKSPKTSHEAATRRIADQCIAVRLRMLNRVITGVYDEAIRPLGVTAGQVNILVTVETLGKPRQADVGRGLYMEKSTLSRNVERLRRKGWLEVTEQGEDHARHLAVTARGRTVIDRAMPLWEKAQTQARRIIGTAGEDALRAAADGLWKGEPPD
ncbi:MAG: MarR family transcriptional regulator [Myxococcales bacterium]|jgi:DNA-binding MarR family transcriptional regulator|nr:MAG: MarR family transcriptional regulator [Myxococcales bacterium]